VGSEQRSAISRRPAALPSPLPPLDHPTLPHPRPLLLVEDRHQRRADAQVVAAAGDEAIVGGGLPDAPTHRLAGAAADFVLAVLDLVPELARVRPGVLHLVAVAAGLDDPKSQPRSLLTLELNRTAISLSRSTFSRNEASPAPTPVASMTTNVACQWLASATILP
jgi:hypothetical protein